MLTPSVRAAVEMIKKEVDLQFDMAGHPDADLSLERAMARVVVALEQTDRERDATEGTLSMTVDRLGGCVEGRPTSRINFLQRIDELREIERKAAQRDGD